MTSKNRTTPEHAGDLRPLPENPRTATPEALAALERSMERYGDLSGIVYNRRSGHLIAGHQRLKHFDPQADVVIAERLRRPNRHGTTATGYVVRGEERWTYREVDVDEQTELEMNVRANVAAGAFEPAGLASIVKGLRDRGSDLAVVGFTAAQLSALLGKGEASPVQEPPVPEPPAKPVSKEGQIYDLGGHRLACGDCRDNKLMRALLGELHGHVACVFTDPPYGVDYQGGRPIIVDNLKRDAFATMLSRAFEQHVLAARADAGFYIWHASETRRDFDTALLAVGLQERQQIIWVRSSLVPGGSDYQWTHEPCIYAVKAGSSPAFYGPRDQVTVWRFGSVAKDGTLYIVVGQGLVLSDGAGTELYLVGRAPKGKKLRHLRLSPAEPVHLTSAAGVETVWEVARESKPQHPTQKPVALAHRAILNSSRDGEWVLDGFGGSGNTLLAADMLGRHAALVEQDPAYCDVIRQRYADFKGDARWSPIGKLTPKARGTAKAAAASAGA
jgi:DNA modification methylase